MACLLMMQDSRLLSGSVCCIHNLTVSRMMSKSLGMSVSSRREELFPSLYMVNNGCRRGLLAREGRLLQSKRRLLVFHTFETSAEQLTRIAPDCFAV